MICSLMIRSEFLESVRTITEKMANGLKCWQNKNIKTWKSNPKSIKQKKMYGDINLTFQSSRSANRAQVLTYTYHWRNIDPQAQVLLALISCIWILNVTTANNNTQFPLHIKERIYFPFSFKVERSKNIVDNLMALHMELIPNIENLWVLLAAVSDISVLVPLQFEHLGFPL